MHAVMQYLDFARPADEQSVREQVMQLRERRLLTPEQAAAIDVHEIAQFLRSPLAQRIRQAETLYREYRFALLVPATLYDPKVDEREQMMLQGVVDGVGCHSEVFPDGDGDGLMIEAEDDEVHFMPRLRRFSATWRRRRRGR